VAVFPRSGSVAEAGQRHQPCLGLSGDRRLLARSRAIIQCRHRTLGQRPLNAALDGLMMQTQSMSYRKERGGSPVGQQRTRILGRSERGVKHGLVANRLTAPASEHALAQWLESDFVSDRCGRRFIAAWRDDAVNLTLDFIFAPYSANSVSTRQKYRRRNEEKSCSSSRLNSWPILPSASIPAWISTSLDTGS
jgi:hypothetical protein